MSMQRLLSVLIAGLACIAILTAAPLRPAFAQTQGAQPRIVKLFDNGNIYLVQNRPTRSTQFTLPQAAAAAPVIKENGMGLGWRTALVTSPDGSSGIKRTSNDWPSMSDFGGNAEVPRGAFYGSRPGPANGFRTARNAPRSVKLRRKFGGATA
jgi:hypothetical protein